MGMKFTDDQQKAIDANGKQLLLSAAAGSGKTAVLIERIFRIITDGSLNVDIDRLLVLTFTEAAALEMKTRIVERLEKSLEINPEDENLVKQLNLVNYANISTMHSFCSKLIRNNFHMLDIDPSFKISGIEEPILLKLEAMFQVMEAKYQEGNESFYDLVEMFGNKVMDNGLVEIVEKLYNYSQNSPFPKQWLSEVVEKYNNNNSLNETKWIKVIKDHSEKTLIGAIQQLNICIKMAKEQGGFDLLLDGLYTCSDFLNNYLGAVKNDITSVYYLVQDTRIKTTHIYRGKNKDAIDVDTYEKIKDIYKSGVREIVNKLSDEFFCKPMEEFAEDVYKLYPYMLELQSIIDLLDEHYNNKKREKNILDFNDLEHFALKILMEEVDGVFVPSEVSKELQDFYYEILVDEYQDTNLVQETIINAIAKDKEGSLNKFMVGDVKQSIYKFRRAKPELFMEKYMSFATDDKKNDLRINLSKNFRSKGIVLDNINFIFTQLMSLEFGGIPYDDSAMLHLGAEGYKVEQYLSNNVEYIIGDNSSDNEIEETEEVTSAELEARIIGTKIIEMVESYEPLLIQCGDGLEERRAVKYGDIVVLLRSMTSVSTFIDEFKKLKIPAYGSNKISYFKTIEVQTMISLLQIIDNSYQDLHLIGVLHSPIYNFTDNELLEIKSTSEESKFYNCLLNYSEFDNELSQKVRDFLEDLFKWKKLSKKVTISELIWNIYTETNYLIYVLSMINGKVREGNLRILHEKALDYEKTSFKDLFNFLKYVEQLERSDTEVSSAKSVSENENAVKIMTIHKSKGLEFPVVFVSQMGKQFNLFDERSNLVIHEELGFSFKYFDPNLRVTYDTMSRQAIIKQIHNENLAEELRILYVALTRAKEKLIVTGVVKNLSKQKEEWSKVIDTKEVTLPISYLTNCKTQFDFIMPCLIRSKNSYGFYESGNKINEEIYNYKTDFTIKVINNDNLKNEMEEVFAKRKVKEEKSNVADIYFENRVEIFEKLSWENEYFEIPTMVTISELKRKDEVKQVYDIGYEDIVKHENTKKNIPLPKFMDKEENFTGAKKGAIIHKIMEFLDLKKHKTLDDIKMLTKELVEKSILTDKEVSSININKILNFINSDLGQRVMVSNNIYKETNFVIGIDANEIYENVTSNKKVLLHGCIDCFFEEEDHIVLLDYKSDYYNAKTKETLINNYMLQMDMYKRAIERSTNKKVKDTYIYLFYGDEFVKV